MTSLTPSQKLRLIILRLHETRGLTLDFEAFYSAKMQEFTEQIQKEIDQFNLPKSE